MIEIPYAAVIASRDLYKRDPLKYAKLLPHQKLLIQSVADEIETADRAGNKRGKTTGGAYLGVGLARGVREIDGVLLPKIRVPNVGYLVTKGHAPAVDSSIEAYRKALGLWPHKFDRSGPMAYSAIHIATDACLKKHGMGEVCDTCSRVVVFVDRGIKPQGVRLDWVHGDEPPSWEVWREMRQRDRADGPLYMWITFTPLYRKEWQWLREDYEDFADQWPAPRNGKRVITATGMENWPASQAKYDLMVQKASTDELANAVINGDYCDIEGMSPWGEAQLLKLQELLRDATSGLIVPISIRRGQDEKSIEVPLETWFRTEPHECYILTADTSKGLVNRDPNGFHVSARRLPRLVARYNGFLDGYNQGLLAAHVAEAYNNARIDFDDTGGYGRPFALGLAHYRSREWPRGYQNLVADLAPERPGHEANQLGFNITVRSRAQIISSIRDWLDDLVLLRPSFRTWSPEVFRCLLDVRMNELTGKIEGEGNVKDEDMTCLGRFLFLNDFIPMPRIKDVQADTVRELFKKEFGRDVLPIGYGKREKKQPRKPIERFRSSFV